MSIQKEIELLEAICHGVDPRDGTLLETPRDPDLDKARLTYLSKLKRLSRRAAEKSGAQSSTPKPLMHGKAWSHEDDDSLRLAWMSEPDIDAAALGIRFGRVTGAIIARLAHVGIFPDRESAREENQARLQRTQGRATN